MKDEQDKDDENYYRYIILYSEIKENKGNEIDFFFYFKDKKEKLDADSYILTNNLWNYFKKINYNYKEEYKIIYNESKQQIGYVVRSSPISRIEYFVTENEKKEVVKNNDLKISKNKGGIKKNFQQKMVQNNFCNIKMSVNSNSNKINKDNNIIPNFNMSLIDNKNNNINQIANIIQDKKSNNEELIQKLQKENNSLKDENTNLKKCMQLKEEENKKLKERIDNLISKKEPNLVDFDNIIVVLFLSMDHSVMHPIKCLPSDTFADVEEKLYKIIPEYRETNNAFQVDGRNILRFKTIAENNIQNGHPVQITKIE